MLKVTVVLLMSVCGCLGAEDGLARTPPRGWRSWNAFHRDIDQETMMKVATAMTVKRDANGDLSDNGKSLLEFGYSDVGLDDNWQAINKGKNGTTFHDDNGYPLVNTTSFPDMKKMVDFIHNLGFSVGWYHNNCIQAEKVDIWGSDDQHYKGDVQATKDYGFDSVKLDGCGVFRDLDKWYKYFSNGTTNTVVMENCHWGEDKPDHDHCPFHFYRTSTDINPVWDSIYSNLQTTRPFQGEQPLSRPGCWAYPDMLEVGMMHTTDQDRAHFGAWCIVSSPLILSFNVLDEEMTKKIWPIITNELALRVNQEWAGHPGRLSTEIKGKGGKMVQVWLKPLSGGSFAVLFLNDNEEKQTDSIQVSIGAMIPKPSKQYKVTDIWKHADITSSVLDGDVITVSVNGHASLFLLFEPNPSENTHILTSNDATALLSNK